MVPIISGLVFWQRVLRWQVFIVNEIMESVMSWLLRLLIYKQKGGNTCAENNKVTGSNKLIGLQLQCAY